MSLAMSGAVASFRSFVRPTLTALLPALLAALSTLVGTAAHAQAPVQWSTAEGGNGHWYQRVSTDTEITWAEADAAARATGGHLVTLTSPAEAAWIQGQLIDGHPLCPSLEGEAHAIWLGLRQQLAAAEIDPAAGWSWVTGEPVVFSNWAEGEPDDSYGGENFAGLLPTGAWDDLSQDAAPFCMKGYVIEWSGDCDGDGVVDFGQIAAGELADANGNRIPDCCEGAGTPTDDCNANGEPDACELETDGADTDLDLVLDACERAFGDLDLDGVVGAGDLALLLEAWGMTGEGAAGELLGDLDLDGVVGAADLSLLLARWGERAPWELPTIRAVSPAGGPAEGGTRISITGWNLSGATSVEIGEDMATDVVVVDETRILATTPAGPVGPATVIVRTPAGVAELADGFAYQSGSYVLPTITSVTPNQGVTTGGTAVTITGTNLTGATSVKFGTTSATAIVVVNDTTITAVTPAGSAGAKSVSVTTPGGTGSLASAFTYFAPPAITTISPTAGPAAGGNTVTINGSGFLGATSVTIGGVAVTSFTITSSTKITAIAPASTPGAKDVVVSGPWGTATKTGGYTSYALPTVTSVTPNQGSTTGGTAVTITGTNFLGTTAVKFGSTSATAIVVVNDTTITAVTPAASAGAKSLSVTTPGGIGTLASAFTYFAPPAITTIVPAIGPTTGGTAIAINGSGLLGATSVTIGGVAVSAFTITSSSKITTTAPASTAGAKDVVVTGPWGTATKTGGYTHVLPPTISSVSPNQGPTAGGTAITITGTNLTGATSVKIGSTSATSVVVVSDTTITAVTPAASAGAKSVSVTTPGGTLSVASAFTYFAPPAITTIVPAAGPVAGGNTVTINGSGFLGATSVTIGGVAVSSFTVTSSSKITTTAPASTAGAKDVVVSGPWGTATKTGGYTYVLPPAVASVTPNQGPTAGGTSVTITGTNLTGATSVKFGTASATGVVVVNETTITATTPATSAGLKSVSVTTPGGTSTLASAFTFVSAPTITSVSPNSGPAAGGTTITIAGTNLTGANAVTIGGVAATSFSVTSATSMTAVTPAGTAGAKTVSVTTPGGTANLANGFTYNSIPAITSVTPNQGPTTGGTAITITGAYLTGTTSVTVGGVAATSVVSVNDTTVTAVTPAGTAGAKDVALTASGVVATAPAAFTYVAAPTIASVSPSAGPTAGGTSITIAGTSLTGTTSVTIGGVAATSFSVTSATSVTAVVPAGTAGAKTVSVTTPGGTANLANGFTYFAAPTIASASPSVGPITGGTAITITGANLTGTTSVTVGGVAATSVVVVNPTTVTAVTPANSAGAKTVSVTTPGGTANLANGFTYFAAPAIASVSPNQGPTAGGTAITITGTNLAGTTALTVGGVAATSVTVVNATTVTAVTPAGAAGGATVALSTPGGVTSVANGFTYVAAPTIASVSPSAGPTAGGTSITITGTNLAGATSVTVDGVAATSVTVVNATTVTAVTPAGTAGAKTVSLTTVGGTANLANGFTYVAAPTIASVNPSAGPTAGGTSITITGANLTGATSVTIDSVAATSVSVVNATTVTAVTPAGTAGAKTVSLTTVGGTANLASGFTYVAAPTIASVSPSAGPTSGGTSITITGANLTTATGVTIGGVSATFSVTSATSMTATTPAGTVGAKAVVVTTTGGSATAAGAFTYLVYPSWATVLEPLPDASVVTDAALRNAIVASGFPWRVRDNGTQIEMVLIPSGSFTMGCSASNAYACGGDENPQRTVTLTNAFYLGRYEVTQAQWQAKMGSNPSYFQGATAEVLAAQVPSRPVELVSWNMAQGFLSSSSMRLPTEAEWEYAYRAGTTTAFHGLAGNLAGTNDDTLAPSIGWYTTNAANQTRPVGGKAGNGFGLHDMAGNVYEWVSDRYGAYPSAAEQNPAGPASGTNRVLRGGSWFNNTSFFLRSSFRSSTTPDFSTNYFGVRVARTATDAPPSLTAVWPNQGPTTSGTAITISGVELAGTSSVTIGGVAATSVTVVNSTTVTAVAVAGTAGAKTVSVTTPNGTANLANGFTFVAAPTIASVSPSEGPTTGGTSITITGTNFYNGTTNATVTVDGVAATSVVVVNPSTITAITPAGTAGAKTVSVATPSGTANLASAFTYLAVPTIASVSPSVGPIVGGTSITITGTNLTGTTSVTVGGVAATSVAVVNATTVTAVTPAGAAGAKTVSLTTPGGTANLANGFTYVAAPTITSVSPNQGPTTGGTSITITGTNLTGTTSVTVGGVAATSVVVGSTTSVTATVPAGAAGAATVALTTPGGTATLANAFTYFAAPTIASVSPSAGPVAGGTTITITGANLTGTTAVTIGGVSATSFSVTSATSMTAVTPAGTAGAKTVSVTTPGGTGSLSSGFTYFAAPTIASVSPSAGPTTGGTSITITGANFYNGTSNAIVTVGGVSATSVVVVNPSTITAVTPAGTAGAKTVSVTTVSGTANLASGFTYVVAPTIASVSPTAGPTTGGTSITITGTNLTGATSVTVGGTAATSFTVVNATTVTAVTPAATAGAKNVVVTTPGGSATAAGAFTYLVYPSWATVLEQLPDPAIVTSASLRNAIVASGFPWRVRDISTQIEMVLIPAGSFTMGCSASNAYTCGGDESPQRTVTLTNAFYLGRYEVTQAQWTASMGSNPSYFQSATAEVLAAQVPSRPVELVSWNMAQGYLQFTNMRLPTEAEWEYAYRAGTTTAFHGFTGTPSGTNDDTLAASIGWYTTNAANQTRPVGGKAGNGFGLHDMAGNVYEWVSDRYGAYPSAAEQNPAGPASGTNRVLRGGSWFNNTSFFLRSSFRSSTTPDFSTNYFGIRVARTATDTPPSLTGVSPNQGPTAGGTAITISGTELSGATSVTIGGVAATSVTVVNPTTVTAVVPAGTAGAKTVSVTTPNGTANLASGFTYFAVPTIASVSPSAGPTTGGTSITITGTNLTGTTAVTVGGVAATAVAVVDATMVTATTPAGTAGAKTVSLTTPGGTANLASGFTYVAAPTVTSVSPNQGPIAGGTSITITGTNLYNGTTNATVSVGGVAATSVVVVNSTTITAITPAGTAGAKTVSVTTPSGTANLANGFTYFAAPTITSVSPSAGPTTGGTTITITGTNLTGTTAVTVGGVAATSVVVGSATSVTATVPAGAAGAATVALTTPGGTASLASAFTYFAAPTIASVSPTSGPIAGGTSITITGTNLTGTTAVTIGGVAATSFSVTSATSMTAVTPAGTAGAKTVSVTTPGGTASLASAFTYFAVPTVASVSPTSGPTTGGTSITITGTNLTGTTAVTVGGVAATSVVVVSATSVTATVPAGAAGAATVALTTPGGTASLASAFTYFAVPTVTSVSPTSGPAAGGTTITITGTNLTGTTSVTIGGVAATSFSVTSATSVTAVTPAGTAGAKTVSVTTPGGTGSLSNGFTYIAAPTITNVTPSAGPTTGGTTITITGTNLTGATSVTVSGFAATSVTVSSATTLTAVTPAHSVGTKSVAVSTPGGTATAAGAFTYLTYPSWATVLEPLPDPAIVTDASLRAAIVATGFPWRVRDNGTQIEMVLIPSGAFDMGCSAATGSSCSADESPIHQVQLTNAFYLGRYEVTQAQWQAKMGSNPSYFQSATAEVLAAQVPNRPVELVSWNMAQEFLAASSMRLPTEAEWEFAYRAGTTTAFHGFTGNLGGTNSDAFASSIAWFNTNAVNQTRPVGGKAGNGFGLHDMAGNVYEWVSDWYGTYSAGAVQNPLGPASGTNRVLRGGSWFNTTPFYLRSSFRSSTTPDFSANYFGIRVARSAVSSLPAMSGIAPSNGSISGGTPVTISGTNLAGTTSVMIGGVPATSVVVVNPTTVTAVTPPGNVGARDVIVTTSGGVGGLAAGFTYFAAPTATAVSPTSGTTAGGTTITITGTNLTGTTSVAVGGVACTGVTVVSPTTVTAVTPAGVAGAATVSITTPGGTANLWNAYTYVAWFTVLENFPDPAVVTDATLRNAIIATGHPWRIRDTGTNIEMVLIPPGTFNMGCSASNASGCGSWESPVHSVTLTNAFYLGRYEVTQAQWTAKMGSNPSNFQSTSAEVPAAQVPNRPVEQVSWTTIQGFLTATGMRLPTEAEWEYAYRAGTTTAFHGFTGSLNGTNDDTLVGNIAWQSPASNSQTRPVGGKAANGFGLHDMSGNVWEWVSDWYSSSYYASSPSTNPPGPSSGTYRVLRGGSWLGGTYDKRSSSRSNNDPGITNFDIGFRVAKAPG